MGIHSNNRVKDLLSGPTSLLAPTLITFPWPLNSVKSIIDSHHVFLEPFCLISINSVKESVFQYCLLSRLVVILFSFLSTRKKYLTPPPCKHSASFLRVSELCVLIRLLPCQCENTVSMTLWQYSSQWTCVKNHLRVKFSSPYQSRFSNFNRYHDQIFCIDVYLGLVPV